MVVKSVEVDLSVTGAEESRAKLEAISLKADALKKQFGSAYAVRIDSAAATAKLGVFRADFKAVADAVTKPQDMQVLTGRALKSLAGIQAKAEELKARFPEFTVRINDKVAKAELDLFAAEAKVKLGGLDREIAGAGSGGGGLAGLFGAGSAGGGPLAALMPSAGGAAMTAGVVAALAALPGVAQIAGAGITGALGAAFAGLAVYGASKTKAVQDSFASLKTHASADLAQIGVAFVPVMTSILGTARSVMDKLTPVFAGAAKIMAKPVKDFGDALLSAFNQPAVKASIDAIAKAFGAILRALTPQLAGDIGAIANGFTNIANAVAKNPKAFADFISGMAHVAGAVLTATADLILFANYIDAHFGPAMHRVAVIFDGVRHDIAHIWDQIFENSAGMVIRLAHNVETQFNSWRHGTAVVFDGMRGDIAHYWDMTWNNTVSRTTRGLHDTAGLLAGGRHTIASTWDAVRHDASSAWDAIWNNTVARTAAGVRGLMTWVDSIHGKVSGALAAAGTWLVTSGQRIVTGLWDGLQSVWQTVEGWFRGLPSKILHALGIASPPKWAIDAGSHIMSGLLKGIAHGAADVRGFFRNIALDVAGPFKGIWSGLAAAGKDVWHALFGGGGGAGAPQASSHGSVQAMMQSMAAARGWTGAQWNALYAVEMAEAGFNLNATNPSSGAYGLAQFINGPSEYAQYGGNSTTAAGQITGMLSYIAQRYGTPEAAWAHEQAYHWYGSGTPSAAPGWAWVGERGPELMKLRGGEQVAPVRAGRGGGGVAVSLELGSTGNPGFDEFMLKWVRQNVRVKGGGDVQKAFGR